MEQAASDYVLAVRVLHAGSIVMTHAVEAESEPKTLHLLFLASVPKDPDYDALESIKTDRERFVLGGSVFYLHAPEDIGRSKLAANAEKLPGVCVTGRNWRTVRKIMAMASQCG